MMTADAKIQSVYTPEERNQYFDKIQYSAKNLEPTLKNLTSIVNLHVKAIPFGALSLIYYKELANSKKDPVDPENDCTTKGIGLSPNQIFTKLVVEGREGHCFEHNGLLRPMLQSLGFECMSTCARVVDFGHFKQTGQMKTMGAYHEILIVKVEEQLFLVDVGFGPRALTAPVPIGKSEATSSEGGLQHRVVSCQLSSACLASLGMVPKSYHLQVKSPKSMAMTEISGETEGTLGWDSMYYFTLTPNYSEDIEMINFYITHATEIMFHRRLIVVKYIDNGQLMLLDKRLVITKEGKAPEIKIVSSEKERRCALKSYFGIHIPDDLEEHLPIDFGME